MTHEEKEVERIIETDGNRDVKTTVRMIMKIIASAEKKGRDHRKIGRRRCDVFKDLPEGQTNYCAQCEGLARENERLKSEAKMGNIPYAEAIELKKENEKLGKRLSEAMDILEKYDDLIPEAKAWVGKNNG